MSRVLIVDDEASICWAFREFLADEGHDVRIASTAEEGLATALNNPPDAVVLDVRLPGMDGLSALAEFRRRDADRPVIVMTAFGSLDVAVRALEGGAFDYLVKPFDLEQAASVVQRALERTSEVPADPGPSANYPADALIGASPAMQDLFKRIALVAPADVPVLITGESGTGKELVARAIHRHSSRRTGPFLPICPAALSPSLIERELFGHVRGAFTGADRDRQGLLELAAGGTVLLDEVGDVPLPVQVKLLRALEHREVTPVGDARPRPVDIRVIAATNRPLEELMAQGLFREDLFFRLGVFRIHLPPLRQRREDVPALAEFFLRRAIGDGGEARLSTEALAALRDRDWPGNVRELRNAVEHAAIVARGGLIQPEHLPSSRVGPQAGPVAIDQQIRERLAAWALDQARQIRDRPDSGAAPLYERFLDLAEPPILSASLEASQGNRAAAAEVLGIHRATLRERLRKHGLD